MRLPLTALDNGLTVKSMASLTDGKLATSSSNKRIVLWPKDGLAIPAFSKTTAKSKH